MEKYGIFCGLFTAELIKFPPRAFSMSSLLPKAHKKKNFSQSQKYEIKIMHHR